MKVITGKDQTYSRELNSALVLDLLREKEYSATELAEKLSLSNATISSILKTLVSINAISIFETTSITGYGRKRILYELNPNFGLILSVNISNLHAMISISNTKEEILATNDLKIEKYDTTSIYNIVLESTKLLMNFASKAPLKYIVLSLPGRVNAVSGELMLSKQFDKELFKEENFIQNLFKKQFNNVPIKLINDIKLKAIAELKAGELKHVENAIYMSIDYGIGGALIINGKLFNSDYGFAGEYGLLKYFNGEKYDAIDEFVSLRALCKEASKMYQKEISKEELIELYSKDENIRNLVLSSASILGDSIANLCEVFDINKFVITGRIALFGEEYLAKIKERTAHLINKLDISYSNLDKSAEIIGSTEIGISHILKEAINKNE